jgi:hypothetical protein
MHGKCIIIGSSVWGLQFFEKEQDFEFGRKLEANCKLMDVYEGRRWGKREWEEDGIFGSKRIACVARAKRTSKRYNEEREV